MTDFRIIDTGGARLRVAVEGDGPLVVLVHGFPESWYSWRHQLGPLARAGYMAAAIDVRGYGGSDKPHAVAAYAMEHMVADIIGVIDALSPDRAAIVVGHDWGAPMAWTTALTRPDRVRAVAALSVPHMGVPARPFTEIFRQVFTDRGRFFYQEWFQREGPAEAEAEADVRGYLRRLYYAISGDAPAGGFTEKPTGATLLDGLVDPPVFPDWLTAADLDYLVGEFERSGLRGPLNRYRNHERDFDWLQRWKGQPIAQPALFIGGTRDPATTMFGALADPVAAMRPFVTDLEGHILDGCGHWTQQERPDEVNRLLLDWLARRET